MYAAQLQENLCIYYAFSCLFDAFCAKRTAYYAIWKHRFVLSFNGLLFHRYPDGGCLLRVTVCTEKLMLGLPPAITVIKDADDAAAVAAANRSSSISAPLITRTAATPQDSPKDVDFERVNNNTVAATTAERCQTLQLPLGAAVIIIIACLSLFLQ